MDETKSTDVKTAEALSAHGLVLGDRGAAGRHARLRGQGEHRAGGEAEGAAAAQLLLLHGETNGSRPAPAPTNRPGAQQTAAQARAKPRCCPAPGPRARPGRGGPAQRDGVVSERSS